MATEHYILPYFPFLRKITGLWEYHHPISSFIQLTNCHETWYERYATGGQLNLVLPDFIIINNMVYAQTWYVGATLNTESWNYVQQ
jgi:hypothetical protein